MQFFEFPNMKECFVPDPGHTMFEVDLSGADAMVVAWRCGNEAQKKAFREGLKIHIHNGIQVFGREAMFKHDPKGKSEPYYTRVKKGVHATHYGARDAAQRCGMSSSEWKEFQRRYFEANPSVKNWMAETEFNLQTTRKVRNPFGWDVTYYDRPESAFTDALAWEPSSVVALVTYEAMERLEQNPNVIVFLQVHDSLLGQIPTTHLQPTLTWMYDELHSIYVDYPDPLVIPWGLKLSEKSWGDMREVSWNEFLYKSEKLPELAYSL